MTLSDRAADVTTALSKLAATWSITLYGLVTLHNVALFMGAALSALQIYVLFRDKLRKPEHLRKSWGARR